MQRTREEKKEPYSYRNVERTEGISSCAPSSDQDLGSGAKRDRRHRIELHGRGMAMRTLRHAQRRTPFAENSGLNHQPDVSSYISS